MRSDVETRPPSGPLAVDVLTSGVRGLCNARPGTAGLSRDGLPMSGAPMPTRVHEPEVDDVVTPDLPWNVVVWDDPVNLMSYVVWVFRKLFGYSEEEATRLMLQVHHEGKAVVSSGPREHAELDAQRLHHHGLWATIEKST